MYRFAIVCICLFVAATALAEDTGQNLTILMDKNLILPTADVSRSYTRQSRTPLTTVVRNANSENEIGQGLEAHLVITADGHFLEKLANQGLIDVTSTHTIAQTQLVLVTGARSGRELLTKHLSFAAALYASPSLPVYMESEETIAGQRAALLLKGFEFSTTLAARAETKESVADMLAALRAENSLGIMLASDAAAAPDITILSAIPAAISAPVEYQVAVLASESMEDARNFANYLDTKPAQKLLQKAGLSLPE